jgi:CDP-glucose 4,6-dehydratase
MGGRQSALEGVALNPGEWKNRRVLLTGHTGFKGAWLSLWLQEAGAELLGYSLPAPTQPSLFEVAFVGRGMSSVEADIRDPERLANSISGFAPEVVIHMAAQSLVRRSYTDPIGTYATNVIGTANVLEAVRGVPSVRAVVIVTSDKCYENRERELPYTEQDAMGGHDPYSSSKGCAELVTAAYRNSFLRSAGVGLASARAGNVIGGGDWAEDRLLPDVMRAVIASRPVQIRNPHAVRPWQHVLEPISGYLDLAEKLMGSPQDFAESWNFGPEQADEQPVSAVVERVVQLWGPPATWTRDERSHPHEAGCLRLDSSKARTRLRWRSQWTLDQALQATVAWYKAYATGAEMREFTIRQMSEYPQTSSIMAAQ